ncbi:hypothetical protein [Aeromonas bestiarum]|uniref:hypothetical protein n=1 Tax=Aeromonas bestiarum TaxID=105751 RepID=UPI003D1D64B1
MNYWVVGASWGGTEHQDQKFVKGGYWMLGWEEKDQPAQYALAEKMKAGDRIAIKRMKGKGKTGIKVFHTGIIQDVILETNKVICTVNWVATDLKRDISESRGCFASIHGPFTNDAWVQEVFCL